jgi:hypothetical protein
MPYSMPGLRSFFSSKNSLPFHLLLLVALLRLTGNFFYFQKYGALSSIGGDIWYFIGVAKGYQHLFWGDPLQWILPLFKGLQPETLFYGLVLFSNVLHLCSVYLLFRLIQEIGKDEIAAFWGGLFFSVLMTSVLFSTAAFHHQQVVLPILIGLIWISYRILNSLSAPSKQILFVGLLALYVACAIGPDITVILTFVLLFAAIQFLKPKSFTSYPWAIPTILLVVFSVLFHLVSPIISESITSLAANLRGIDLASQRALKAGDLMPFAPPAPSQIPDTWWRQALFILLGAYAPESFPALLKTFLGHVHHYSLLAYGLLGILIWAWWKKYLFPVTLVLVAMLVSSQAARFNFLTEVGFSLLFGIFLSQRKTFRVKTILGIAMVLLFLATALGRGSVCHYPGQMVKVLLEIPKDPRPSKLVFCSSTYGFLIQSVTGAKTTSDLHHLDFKSIETASKPAHLALQEFRAQGITHLWFTTYDFRVEQNAILTTGGYDQFLPQDSSDIEKMLIFQALKLSLPPAQTNLLAAEVHEAAAVGMVLYQLK